MRNLKRVLSLALTAMTLSVIMIITASAAKATSDFSDYDKIQNTEAVDVLTLLNVINGKDDGTFDPTGNVTRSEMAKMICVLHNGGKDSLMGANANSLFTDTVNHWAKSYIVYCTNLGVVSGRGDGTFDPDANVTGVEAAKMLLAILGYDAEAFQLTGTNWAASTQVIANSIGMFDGIQSAGLSAPLSRDGAARMIYNALNAYVVKKTYSQSLPSGALNYSYELSKYDTLLNESYGVWRVEGVVTGNEYTDGASMYGKTRIAEITNPEELRVEDGSQSVSGTIFNVATGADDLGKSITMYVRPASSINNSSQNATVLGEAAVNDSNRVLTVCLKLVNDSTKSNDVTSTLRGAGLQIGPAQVITNYDTGSISSASSASSYANLTGAGIVVDFIDHNGDAVVDVIRVLRRGFGKIAVASIVNDGMLQITPLGNAAYSGVVFRSDANTVVASFDSTDANFAELGLTKDDYVFYYQVPGAGMWHVEKVAGLTVVVTAAIGDELNGDRLVSGGVRYNLSDLASETDISAALGNTSRIPDSVKAGETAELYLDGYQNIVYIDGVDTASHYLMIEDVAVDSTWHDTLQAKVILSDGTRDTITVSRLGTRNSEGAPDMKDLVRIALNDNEIAIGTSAYTANSAWAALDAATLSKGPGAARIYSYTVGSNGSYELIEETTLYKSENAGGGAVLTSGTPVIRGLSGGADQVIATDATPIVVQSGSSVTFFEGIGNAPTRKAGLDSAATLWAVKSLTDDTAEVIFTSGGESGTSISNYIYFLREKPLITDTSSGRAYIYDVVANGEVTTVQGTAADLVTNANGPGLYYVTYSDGKVSGLYNSYDGADTAGRLVSPAFAERAGNGVVNGYYYDGSTRFFLIQDGGVTETSAGAIVTTKGIHQDIISIVTDSAPKSSTALYVFIMRDGVGNVTMSGTAGPAEIASALNSSRSVVIVPDSNGKINLGGNISVAANQSLILAGADSGMDIGTITVEGTVEVRGNVSSGRFALDGGTVTLTGKLTKAPDISGTGNVLIECDMTSGMPNTGNTAQTAGGIQMVSKTAAALAPENGETHIRVSTTTVEREGAALSGDGKITSYSNSDSINSLAEHAESDTVTFYALTLENHAGTLTSEMTLKNGTTVQDLTVNADGTVVASNQTLIAAVGDSVSALTYTIQYTEGETVYTEIFTFQFVR